MPPRSLADCSVVVVDKIEIVDLVHGPDALLPQVM